MPEIAEISGIFLVYSPYTVLRRIQFCGRTGLYETEAGMKYEKKQIPVPDAWHDTDGCSVACLCCNLVEKWKNISEDGGYSRSYTGRRRDVQSCQEFSRYASGCTYL